MKTKYLILPILALFIITGCKKKKKDENKKQAEAKKNIAMKVVKKDNKTKPVKKVKPAITKKVNVKSVPPSTKLAKIKPLSDIGTPSIAGMINLTKMLASPLGKSLLAKNQVKLNAGMDDFKKTMACVGSKAKNPTEIFKVIYFFANISKNNYAVVADLSVDAVKLIPCILKTSKKAQKAKFSGKDAIMTKTGEIMVDLNKTSILIVKGDDYKKKIKLGASSVGKGEVASYFSNQGNGCVKFMIRNFVSPDLKKAEVMLGKIKSVAADGTISFMKGVATDILVDVQNPKAAKQIERFVNGWLASPAAALKLKQVGLNKDILNNLTLKATGGSVIIKASADTKTIEKVIDIMEKQKKSKAPNLAPTSIKKK